jgi:peptidoglycan/LPS O-acetylase OafA/YrhL
MTPGGRSTLADIDVFRGAAALVVAAMHAREITWIGIRDFWAAHGTHLSPATILGYSTFPLVWGSIGVPIFFVLSGYCIHRGQAMTRARRANSTGDFGLSSGNFLLRRFFRIYPVIAGALLLTLICDWASRQYFPNSVKLGDTSFATFLVNLFSVQGLAGPTYGSNMPLWTLSIEVQFYVLYPLLLIAMARLGNVPTLVALTVLNVVSYFLFQTRGLLLFSSFYVSWYLGALVAEAEAARVFADRLRSPGIRAGLYAMGLAGLAVGCVLFFRSNFLAFQIWAVAFAVFLFAVLKRPKSRPGAVSRFFGWLGTFSFSLYIIHLPVIVLIHSLAFRSVNQPGLGPFYATLAAVIACAYLFSLVFERPALAMSSRLKRESRP